MSSYATVGQRLPRIDATAKVTGRASFCPDVQLPGMLWGKILRSPHAHARIVSVDVTKALALPGIRAAVISGQDIPDTRFTHAYGPGPVDQTLAARHGGRRRGDR